MELYFVLIPLLYFIIKGLFSRDVISITFLMSLMVLLLYVIPFLFLWDTFTFHLLVNNNYIVEFLGYILVCYVSYITGEKLFSLLKMNRVKHNFSRRNNNILEYKKFEYLAFLFGVIGFMFYSYFIVVSGSVYFSGHGQGDYSVGGYVYELRYFVFSSVLMLYTLKLKKRISKIGITFLVFFALFLFMDACIQQQRGSWIRFGTIFLLSNIFHLYEKGEAQKTIIELYKKNRLLFLSGLLVAFMLMFTVLARNFYSKNASPTEVVSKTLELIVIHPDLLFAGSGIDNGNEFVVAYNSFYAQQNRYILDWGYKWLYPFVNFIPRALWKEKPTWENFSTNAHTFIDKYSLIEHAVGSAETGYIDTFYRFGWFSPLFFFFLGYSLAKLYHSAFTSLNSRMLYICLYIGFFYFFTQTALPLIIFTIYMYLPILLSVRLSRIK